MANGVKFGRKPKLSDYQRQEAIKRRAAGETLASIAKSYAVDLSMISRSIRPDFDDLASVEMAYQVGFGGAGFFRHPFANTKKVECMHCVRCDGYPRADLSQRLSLLENSNAITETL